MKTIILSSQKPKPFRAQQAVNNSGLTNEVKKVVYKLDEYLLPPSESNVLAEEPWTPETIAFAL